MRSWRSCARSSSGRKAASRSFRRSAQKIGNSCSPSGRRLPNCASEQPRQRSAHASPALPANDGDNLVIGQANTATNGTSLELTGSSLANPFFSVNANGSDNLGVTAIAAFSNGSSAISVRGLNNSGGIGVQGVDIAGGIGVWGSANDGTGVYAESISGLALSAGGTGRFWQATLAMPGAPTSGFHSKGEQVRDSNGDLFICMTSGTPGTWKKVAAIPAGTLGGALVFLHAPFRLFDTRPGVAGCPIDPGVPMASASVTTLQVTGTASTTDATLVVPTGATGIIGDLLAINVNGNGITGGFAGFLTLQPHSVTPTGNSYLHYYPATVQHNCVVMGLDASGKLDVGNYNTATNVGLDITGYII